MTASGSRWRSRLVVPIDDTELSHRAIGPATAIAHALGVAVQLVTVESPGVERLDARLQLEELRAASTGATEPSLLVESNDVAAALLDTCAATGGLLCMATHARGEVGSALLGSTAKAVLAATRVPVLLVGPGAATPGSLRTIVVSAPPWPGAGSALDAALQLAEPAAATTQVVRVVPEADDAAAQRVLCELDALLGSRQPSTPARTTVTVGVDVAAALAWAIADAAADVAVLPIRKHPRLERLLGQDVLHEVLRRATCPVLVVPVGT